MNYRSLLAGRSGVFEYHPFLFHSGNYNVYLWYPSSPEYASNVTVRIYHSQGQETVQVNQQKKGGQWIKIGHFPFEKGKSLRLAIEAKNLEKITIADAVKFELVK